MASDELVWDIINNQFCSFKIKTTKDQTFCRNEYNVSGFCSKQHCPLANSRYATIRADPATGRLYLYMKTVERAHMPSRWWERVRLPPNYNQALEMIDAKLIYWPKFLIHKCKQRLTRLTQVAIRTKRIQKEGERLGERQVAKLAPKVRKREAIREQKAESAAKVERAIERELIERLRSGAYGDRPLNVEERVWRRVLNGLEKTGEGVQDEDLDDDVEEEWEQTSRNEYEYEQEQEPQPGEVEFVSDDDGPDSLGEELSDLEDWLNNRSGDEEASQIESGAEERDEDDMSEDGETEDAEQLEAALNNLKRKHQHGDPSGRRSKKSLKGAKRGIEYEFERAEPLPSQTLTT